MLLNQLRLGPVQKDEPDTEVGCSPLQMELDEDECIYTERRSIFRFAMFDV